METVKTDISVCNMLFSGLIQGPRNLSDFIKCTILKYRRNLWKYQDHPGTLHAALVNAMMSGNVRILKVFLMFGFEKMVSRRHQILASFGYISHAIRECFDDVGRMTLTHSDLDVFLMNVDRATEKRRRLVLETFIVASCYFHYPPLGCTVFECYELAWRSTPEPFVKPDEMFSMLMLLCGPGADEGIRKICRFYSEKFGESTHGPKQPRTLKHLSRCSLRRELARRFSLPDSIDSLPVPETLKDYLKLHV